LRDLIAQIVSHFELDSIFIHRLDHAGLDLVLPQNSLWLW